MAHGYIGDGYGIDGGVNSDRDDDRERGRRDRQRDWQSRSEDWRERDRDRGMMFGSRERGWSDEDGWSDRGSRIESPGRERGYGGFRDDDRDEGRFGGSGGYSQHRRSLSAHPDDHYRSWRERHMSELDRDYQDYCREREQAFHQDFDAWRSQRHASYQPLRTGMTNSGMSHDPSGEVQATTEGMSGETVPDAMDDATLGTNSGSSTGRGRG